MRSINKAFAIATLILGAQAAQAHITEDATHVHEGSQMRSTIQAMSPTDRLNFRDAMQTSVEGMPAEDRQAFRDNMRTEHGAGQAEQHRYGNGSQEMGQGDQHRYGAQQGQGTGERHGYGRGYGKR